MKNYIRKLKIPIIIQIIFTLLYSITVAIFPLVNKYLFDHILEEGLSLVFKLIGIYVLLILLNLLFQYISRLYEWKVSKLFFVKIKDDLFKHISSLDIHEFNKRKVADYLVIFTENVEAIDEDYLSAYIDLYKSILNIIVFLTTLLVFVDYRISIVVLLSSVLIVFIPKIFKKRLSFLRGEQIASIKRYFDKVLDLLSGKSRINKVTFKNINNEHRSYLTDSEDKRYKFGKFKTISDLAGAFGIFLVEFNTFVIVAILLAQGKITVGVGIAAFGYTTSFLDPINDILSCINLINSTQELVDETMDFINGDLIEEKDKWEDKKVDKLSLENLSITFDNFSLDKVNYVFEKNKRYAILGHSGSGKSSLLKLIDGSLEAETGQIYIDGNPIDDLDEYIFSLKQYEYLFRTDFINNISIFKSMETDTKLVNNFLMALNENMRNKIINYEDINKLSGGEKQIVGIVRMLVADRPIILLDEPFASIDHKTSKIIKDYLLNLQDKIIIEITHDLSEENLSRFDELIHMDEGRMKSYGKV